MTDGPFRNSELSAKWKRYGEDLVSDAASPHERVRQACDSIVHDVALLDVSPLIRELQAHVDHVQLDLDPTSAVEAVFEKHQPSLLTDILQRHLTANIRDHMSKETAFEEAVTSSVRDLVRSAQNRLHEECIGARARGDMSDESYDKATKRNSETFAAIKPSEVVEAVVTSNRRAFAAGAQKKSGVDEGPDE